MKQARPASEVAAETGATSGADPNVAAVAIALAMNTGLVDVVVARLYPFRNRPLTELRTLLRLVQQRTNGEHLERWLVKRIHWTADRAPTLLESFRLAEQARAESGAVEEALRLLWYALPLIDRLMVYEEGYRTLEKAQMDVIRDSSREEREEAQEEGGLVLDMIYANLGPEDEYTARTLIDASHEGAYRAAQHLLDRIPSGTILEPASLNTDEKDALYDAILALEPTRRKTFFKAHLLSLSQILDDRQFNLISTLAQGSEVEALIARLRLATEKRKDDQAAVSAVVARAEELLAERKTLQDTLGQEGLTAEVKAEINARLAEMGNLDLLLKFDREDGGELRENTFMRLVSSARNDAETFAADTQRLVRFTAPGASRREFTREVAKQRILDFGGDLETIQAVVLTYHAQPEQVAAQPAYYSPEIKQWVADQEARAELLNDPEVLAVVAKLHGYEVQIIQHSVAGDEYSELLLRLNTAINAPRYGEVFRLTLKISQNPGWVQRLKANADRAIGALDAYAHVSGQAKDIMDTILTTKAIPLVAVLDFSSDPEVLTDVLSALPEKHRAQLRLGWTLDRFPRIGIGLATDQEDEALQAYREFEKKARSSLGDSADFEKVMSVTLGALPTAAEWKTDVGRYRAAALLNERLEARRALDRGLSGSLSKTSATMDAAAREFAALWLRVRDRGTLSATEFAALAALYDRFGTRAEEFAEASNAIGKLAATIAATVAAIAVVVVTGGTATPLVIALGAAAGAGARVITREMIQGSYYRPDVRDAAQGAIDGALAVVSGELAEAGAGLMGLEGGALAGRATTVAGDVAEGVTQSFGRRVASSTVKGALDQAIFGASSAFLGAMMDDRTWRQGILRGLLKAGQDALEAGVTGAAGGAAFGAAMPVLGRGLRGLRKFAVGEGVERALTGTAAREAIGAVGRGVELEAGEVIGAALPTATGKVELSRLGEIFTCSSPCTILRERYAEFFAVNSSFEGELRGLEQRAEEAAQAQGAAERGTEAARQEAGKAVENVKREAAALEQRIRHEQMQGIRSSLASKAQVTRVEWLLERAEDNGIALNLSEVRRALRAQSTAVELDAVINDLERSIDEQIGVGQAFEEAGRAASDAGHLPGSSVDEGFYLTEQFRNVPGTAHGGEGLTTSTRLLVDGRQGPFPGQIASRMRNMSFQNFADFRRTFWRMVAEDPVLGQGWTASNLARMRGGHPPFAGRAGGVYQGTGGGVNRVLQLNHIRALKNAGGVYDLGNIEIVTPRFHQLIGD